MGVVVVKKLATNNRWCLWYGDQSVTSVNDISKNIDVFQTETRKLVRKFVAGVKDIGDQLFGDTGKGQYIAANIFSDFFKNLNDGIALIREKMEDAKLMKQISIKV